MGLDSGVDKLGVGQITRPSQVLADSFLADSFEERAATKSGQGVIMLAHQPDPDASPRERGKALPFRTASGF